MKYLPRDWAVGSAAGLLVVLGVPALAVSCGSDSSCEETRTCKGSGGGTGGGAGDSGSDAPSACETDDDCENDLVCDGVAKCVDHLCVEGTPVVCTSPDPTHCTSTCAEPSGECEVAPNDLDGDEHLDPDCASPTNPPTLPADDCDDTKDSVYPGATEICDALDNDCDDLADLYDGLLPSGTTADFVVSPVSASNAAIAWSNNVQAYAVVWQDGRYGATNDEILFALMDATGAKSGTEVRVSDATGSSRLPRVAWGNDSFGVAWADDRNGNTAVYFRRLDETGAPLSVETLLSTGSGNLDDRPDIIAIPDGWIVAFERVPNLIKGVRLALDGTVVKPETELGAPAGKKQVSRLAALGNEFGMVWQALTNAYDIKFLRADFNFVATNQIDLTSTADSLSASIGDIASNAADGTYRAVFFEEGNYLSYAELGTSVVPTCGPVSQTSASQIQAAGEIVPFAGGSVFLLGMSGTNTTIGVGVFGSGCGELLQMPLDTASTPSSTPHIGSAASGEAGVAMVWADVAKKTIRRRVMGPHLCD